MKIEIYGTWCGNCQALENDAKKAVEEFGVDAVQNFKKIKIGKTIN